MLKSPEEYLSALEFDSGDHAAGKPELSAGERAFVEKYLGQAALEQLPEVTPEPEPLLMPDPAPRLQVLPALPPTRPHMPPALQIVVAPASVSLEVVEPSPSPDAPVPDTTIVEETPDLPVDQAACTDTIPAPVAEAVQTSGADEADVAAGVRAQEVTATATERIAVATDEVSVAEDATATPAKIATDATTAATVETVADKDQVTDLPEETAVSLTDALETSASPADLAAPTELRDDVACADYMAPTLSSQAGVARTEVLLKDKLRQQAEVQLVSFFVSGQIFLLPVEGIQEVLRHMELIKVPQAPDFVAGVINLRGHVTPVVYLSALLTNDEVRPYDRDNFIIITGTEQLRLGLIIDKVSSMHMVPQNKFIWNPESKLADAAEFLNAIVDLDDRVCGMVAPEAITRLILPEA